MLNSILGFKQKMGAVYIANRRYPVTWIKLPPCVVTQIKHDEKDGYMAVQLGTGSKKTKNIPKPLQGHLKTAENQKFAPRYIREVRIKEQTELKVGDEVKAGDVIKPGDIVTVMGVSKGKGFAGVVKRWRFAGGPKTHGQSDRERAPGSIGQRTTPGRVYKGKKMAGRMGSERVTVKNLSVIDLDEKNQLAAIKGAIPGSLDGLIIIRKTGEGGVKVERTESFGDAQEQPSSVEAGEGEQVEKVDQVNQAIKEEKEEKTENVEKEEKSEKSN